MPTNVTIEYQLAEKGYLEAKTPEEKVRALEKMLATVPSHKSAENLRANLTQRLSKLKRQQEKEKKQKTGRHQISVKKEGAAQIVIIGKTNSGKSTLMRKLTNAKPMTSEFPFTTKLPQIGIMDYNGIKLQIVEIPALVENFMQSEKGPLFLGIIRQADLVVFLLRNNPEDEFKILINELNKANIKINQEKTESEYDFFIYLNGMIVINNENNNLHINNFNIANINDKDLNKKIWKCLGLIYVYTKTSGKKPDFPPIALKNRSTLKDLAMHIHKDFIKKFKYAKVWGKSAKFEKGQIVGLSHLLEESDVVEFRLK